MLGLVQEVQEAAPEELRKQTNSSAFNSKQCQEKVLSEPEEEPVRMWRQSSEGHNRLLPAGAGSGVTAGEAVCSTTGGTGGDPGA